MERVSNSHHEPDRQHLRASMVEGNKRHISDLRIVLHVWFGLEAKPRWRFCSDINSICITDDSSCSRATTT